MAAVRDDGPKKGAMQMLAELWVVRPAVEIASQIGVELKSMPQSIGHELITRGWFGRESPGAQPEFSSIWGKETPALNETGIHGRGANEPQNAVGIHGPEREESRDLYGLTSEERNTIADTRSILEGFGNERAVAQLDRSFLQDIGILDPAEGDWTVYDRLMSADRADDRPPSRQQEMERE